MYSQDWIMRQIEMLVQFIARMLFGKDYIEYLPEDEYDFSQGDLADVRD